MRLVNTLKVLLEDDGILGPMDRGEALRQVGKMIQTGHLHIQTDSRLWDDSMWDYMLRGVWFHWVSEDLDKAHKKARKHGFACDHSVAEFKDGYRVTFPRLVERANYSDVRKPNLP